MRPIVESMAELTAIAQSPTVATVAEAFAQAGEEFALVGGPVRDVLLGRKVTDLDFTTSAHPDKTRQILASVAQKTWDLGREFGTIAARVNGETVEVTTYRADVYREESRKPEVSFSSRIEEDLVRRDFTINALAFMLPEMRLVDVGGGVEDLLASRIDTPGTAERSFSDDPLRMLRAARFASQLGFDVADRVREAITEMAPRLEIVSQERIRDEFVKLIAADDPIPGIRLMVETGLADEFIPELPQLRATQDEHMRHKDVYEHSLTVLRQAIALEKSRSAEAETAPDVTLRIACLLHDIGKPATRRFVGRRVTFYNHDLVGAKLARKRLRTMRFDNDTVKSVSRLIELHLRFFGYSDSEWTDSAVRRYVRDAGDELERLHILTRSDVTTQNPRKARRLKLAYDDIERRIAELAEEEELAAVRPDLNGQQIMELLDLPPGPAVGAAYNYLLEVRLDEGPLGEAEAEQRLREWWAEQDPQLFQRGGKKR